MAIASFVEGSEMTPTALRSLISLHRDAGHTKAKVPLEFLESIMKSKKTEYVVGQVHERWTAFIREDWNVPTEDGDVETIKSWRPGVRHEPCAPDDFEPIWDGEGAELRTIVAVVNINGGGTRLLYRRAWRSPDGKTFGKNNVRMTTPAGFTNWKNGKNSNLYSDIERRREYMASLEEAA